MGVLIIIIITESFTGFKATLNFIMMSCNSGKLLQHPRYARSTLAVIEGHVGLHRSRSIEGTVRCVL